MTGSHVGGASHNKVHFTRADCDVKGFAFRFCIGKNVQCSGQLVKL